MSPFDLFLGDPISTIFILLPTMIVMLRKVKIARCPVNCLKKLERRYKILMMINKNVFDYNIIIYYNVIILYYIILYYNNDYVPDYKHINVSLYRHLWYDHVYNI